MVAINALGNNYEACTGCGACSAACPMDCITMRPDEEGFFHPRIDTGICNCCGFCHRTCPVHPASLNGVEKPGGPHEVLAAWHLDETIRRESSSGGVFTALAENILSHGGAVVGAAYDEHLVVHHTLIETSADLHRLRGSKYVQSQFSHVLYRQILDLLSQGRLVFFTGTPCQVAGLRNFLIKPYDNLLCCDLICHGTPSPLFWERYVHHMKMRGDELAGVSFRDKSTGWKNSSIRLYLQNGRSRRHDLFADPYVAAFLRDYSLRPSCYTCHFTNTNRTGDLTIADFWGVAGKYPEYDLDDKGTSLVLVNTEKGKIWLEDCQSRLFLGRADLETAISGNPMLVRPCHRPKKRDTFYRDLEVLSFPSLVCKYRLYPVSLPRRLLGAIKTKFLAAFRYASNTLISLPFKRTSQSTKMEK